MKNQNYLETEHLDIIFQGRNKAYGAYYIRKTYAQRVKKSLLTLILLVSIGLAAASFKPKPPSNPDKPEWTQPGELIEIELPKDAGEYLQRVIPKLDDEPKVTPIEIAPKEETPKDEPIKKDEPNIINEPSTTASNGETDGQGDIFSGGSTEGQGTIGPTEGKGGTTMGITPIPEPEPTPEPKEYVETMPVFPGGDDALIKFLKENIKYPKLALKLGTEGKVVLNFVIDANGNISSIKIAKGIGGGCDQEAVRVVDRMPKWSPGIQNGKKVPVSFTLPINFSIN
jgi:periplasmic protein TonB